MTEPTSARKIAKAARKSIQKEYRQTVEQEARELGRQLGNSLKPKPWFIPMKVWIMGLSIFMRVK